MSKRIRAWAPIIEQDDLRQAMEFGPAINTGVVGWRRDAAILPEWESTSRQGWQADCTRRIIDEIACQVLLHRFPHRVVDDRWNWSVRHGVSGVPAIIHYHGNKHVGDRPVQRLWLDAYWNLRNTDRRRSRMGGACHGDKALRSHLRAVERDDLTVVTVVNPGYRDKLLRNWPLWMKTQGLREQRFMVFAVGQPDLRFLKQWKNVEIVPWDRMGDGREACLSAFVFAVAEHVTTPYWMKLDCDAKPTGENFSIPDYAGSTITAHRWGYTRVKHDENRDSHWLNRLDDWWGEQPLFPADIPAGQRYGHPRINSYCSIEKTEFTRRLADLCGDRLPVPSQDTTAWYAATRWDEPITRLNMKKWIKQ